MKKTELAKLNAVKLRDQMKSAGTPNRYGKGSGDPDHKATVSPLIEKLLGKQTKDTDAA